MDSRRLLATLTAACCLLPAAAAAAGAQNTTATGSATGRACAVEGAWDLVALTTNGKQEPLGGWRQRKIVGHGQFMWIGHESRRDTLPLRTRADSLRSWWVSGGAGAYRLTGDTYTEHLEFFNDPRMVGQSVAAKCRTEGDQWYHDFEIVASGQTTRHSEVWRRVR